jgi:hypothetical protein
MKDRPSTKVARLSRGITNTVDTITGTNTVDDLNFDKMRVPQQ